MAEKFQRVRDIESDFVISKVNEPLPGRRKIRGKDTVVQMRGGSSVVVDLGQNKFKSLDDYRVRIDSVSGISEYNYSVENLSGSRFRITNLKPGVSDVNVIKYSVTEEA